MNAHTYEGEAHMTYADATTALSDLATTSRYRVPNTERMSALIDLALASMREDAERERAAWDSFQKLLDSAA